MTESPWRRRVSPIFFLLLVVAGLMVGFACFLVFSGLTSAPGA